MTFRGCSYEKELRQALQSGHWPAACATELRDHVRACRVCRDLILVTEAFQQARQQSSDPPNVPAGLVWWRAQLRRRLAAAEQVSAPITVAQIFAWAISIVAAVGFFTSQYQHGLRWGAWWSEMAPRVFNFSALASAKVDWNFVVLIPTVGALALVAAVVVYLVAEKS